MSAADVKMQRGGLGFRPEPINFEGDDIERMALLALTLAILNQAALDLASMELRVGFASRRVKAAATMYSDRAKAVHLGKAVATAESFLRGPDARLACDVVAAASLGKVRLSPDWILNVQVPNLKRDGRRHQQAAANRWERRPA